MRLTYSKFIAFLFTLITGMLFLSTAIGAPSSSLLPEWDSSDPNNSSSINHSKWQLVLDKYVMESTDGINRVAYAKLSNERDELDQYINELKSIDPRDYSKNEQFAYWVNLYNASTVQLIINNYPVKSIRKIKDGFFSAGPWDIKWIEIGGSELSLNNIEHGILRPIWQDPRIHYAVNCASIGCPNLSKTAFTAANLEQLLEKQSRNFINHKRGVSINPQNKVIEYSSIFHWYKVDFGDSIEGLVKHWKLYADEDLAIKIKAVEPQFSVQKHFYDWDLNDYKTDSK